MRYSISQIFYLSTGEDKRSNFVFGVVDNDDDSIIAEFATFEEASQHLTQLGEQS